MPTDDQHDYLEHRAAQERHAADRAACPQTRLIHLELASRYAEQIAALDRAAAPRRLRRASA